MKKIIKSCFAVMTFAIFLSGCSSTNSIAQGPAPAAITYQTFYDDLSPYGTWIDYPSYGHVWHPGVAGDFRPYLTNGYWNYTNDGWMWSSSYEWGWAPFHYGRWLYDDMYGWLWIPGYEWSQAWVTWGSVDNFYAWAPLMPEVNVGIQFGAWRPAAQYWNICDRSHIYDRNIVNVVEKRNNIPTYVNRINVINNFSSTKVHNQFYSKGPEIKDVEKYTNRTITPAAIREVNNRQQAKEENGNLHVYRPAVANPQPREFRRVDNGDAHPVRSNDEKMNTEEPQQRQNVDHLPVFRAPQSSFGGSGKAAAGNRGGRRM
jgi:hypothetical protein